MYNILERRLQDGGLANGYLLTGETHIQDLEKTLKKYGEVHLFTEDLGINEVRKIKEKSARTIGDSSGRAFFILNAEKMSRFVPQAILKMIEDSLPRRHYFVLSRRLDLIPETLRSRLVELHNRPLQPHSENSTNLIKLEEIAGDRERFISFLDETERLIMAENRHEFIPKIRQARESALIFNISRKMCLEYLICTIYQNLKIR